MQALYDKMTAQRKLGPYDNEGNLKPFQEYPKMVGTGDKLRVVKSQREELAYIAETPDAFKDDPVLEQNRELKERIAKLEAMLVEAKPVAAPALSESPPEVQSSPLPAASRTPQAAQAPKK